MKVHQLQNPPPGLTFINLVVEQVEVTARGVCRVKFKVDGGVQTVTVPVEFETLGELPAPGDEPVRVSLWRVP